MSKAADSLQRRFGANLSESLGVRTAAPAGRSLSRGNRPPGTSPDDGRTRAREAGHMELERIVPDPDQPRKEFAPEAIDRLAASLLKHGQLQPLRVRWNGDLGKWVVISGERRYRAAAAGRAEDRRVHLRRRGAEPLGASSRSRWSRTACARTSSRSSRPRRTASSWTLHGWTAKQLAEELHVSEGAISKALSLLRLPEDLRTQADDGAIPATALYEVAKVEDEAEQREIVRRIKAEGLKRDEVVEVVREAVGRSAGGGKAKGRGAKAKPRKVTSRTLRTSAGKVTVENQRGLDAGALAAALREALDLVEAEQRGRGEAA